MILHLFCIISLMFVILGAYFRYCRAGRLMARIPGPARVPIFGHLFAMHKSSEILFEHLRIWRRSYGRLWKLDGPNIRCIHIYHPEDVKLILSTNTYNQKHVPYNFLRGWLGEGLLLSEGDKWHHRRKMLTPAFHFKILKKYFSIFSEHTELLLATIENEVDTERTDLVPFISKTALHIMCETSLCTKVHETPTLDNYLQSVHKMGEFVIKRLTKPWFIVDYIYELSSTARREKSVLLDLHNFTKQIIQKRRKNRNVNKVIEFQDNNVYEQENKRALLDLLLDEEEKGAINDDGIREEIDTFLFEGHDTTATALTFMLMSIANEPEIQDSVCEELHGIYGESPRLPTIEDLSKMKYLECCIKESLRLYPSVPIFARYLTEEVNIAGYRIPKDTMVDIHVFDIHRDPAVYPEPEKFRPERFLPQNAIERNPYSYIPFSAGPRNCIGQKFAIMELKTLISGVLRKYRLEPITRPEDLVFITDLVLRTNHPIYVRFWRRKNLVRTKLK